jgi:hypothetical protein
MIFDTYSLPAVFLIFITASFLLISWDWRLSITFISIQYVGVFFLVAVSWPIEIAVVKVISGWMAGAVLGLAMTNVPQDEWKESPLIASNVIFRILAASMAGLFAITAGASIVRLFPEVSTSQAYAGIIMIALGLLHLGLTTKPFRVILGLLTVLGGFEILYAAVESSILIAGLLATVTLGLAAVGAYLLTAPTLEETS